MKSKLIIQKFSYLNNSVEFLTPLRGAVSVIFFPEIKSRNSIMDEELSSLLGLDFSICDRIRLPVSYCP